MTRTMQADSPTRALLSRPSVASTEKTNPRKILSISPMSNSIVIAGKEPV